MARSMVSVRSNSPPEDPTAPPRDGAGGPPRLNLLLSYGGWREGSWADQLPTLLEPLGVHSLRVSSGREAAEIIESTPVHIALVDLSLPLTPPSPGRPPDHEGGERLLKLLGRLRQPPPTVVVQRRRTSREADRVLLSALAAGAFAVIDRPVHIETVLETLRRVLGRYYAGRWPQHPPGPPPGHGGPQMC